VAAAPGNQERFQWFRLCGLLSERQLAPRDCHQKTDEPHTETFHSVNSYREKAQQKVESTGRIQDDASGVKFILKSTGNSHRIKDAEIEAALPRKRIPIL
jgi:hypothetical protein